MVQYRVWAENVRLDNIYAGNCSLKWQGNVSLQMMSEICMYAVEQIVERKNLRGNSIVAVV